MRGDKFIVGFLILLITSSIVYITLQGEGVRIRVDNDKTTLYVFEDSRWKVGGREYNKLFEGTHKLYRDVKNIKIYTYINRTSNTTTVIRETPFKRGPFIKDTYFFKGNITDKKLFPIYHKVEIYNASGLFYRYEVRDLTCSGNTHKLKGETYLRFGRNVVVKLHPNYRWTWVYKSGIVKAQYDIKSDYEVFYVRLFDPASFSITLNSPANQTVTNDNTPDFSFTVSGTEANYSCELFINDTGYGTSKQWFPNSSIVLGLSDIGTRSRPTVYQKDNIWHLIAGRTAGTFEGFTWNGSQWVSNSSIVSGLGDVSLESAPTVFQMNSTWHLISGDFYGQFHGFTWNESQWISNSSIVSGLGGVGYYSAPTVFQMNSTWHLISGDYDGYFHGFTWNGSQWVSNSSIVSGLGDVGSDSAPTVFQMNSIWYLISGVGGGTFQGWQWNGTSWTISPTIIAGLGDIGDDPGPTVYHKDNIWHLIAGKVAGTFEGFHWNILYNNTAVVITANSSLADGTYNWYINCTAGSVTNQSEVRQITIDTTNPFISYNSNTDSSGTYNIAFKNWIFTNVTVSDANIDSVKLYWNGTPENFLNNDSSNYWSNKTELHVGIYQFYAWVNDTAGNTNQTELREINITKGATNTTLYLDGVSADRYYEHGTVAVLKANVTNSAGNLVSDANVCLDIDQIGYGDNYVCDNGTIEYNLTTNSILGEFNDSTTVKNLSYTNAPENQTFYIRLNKYDEVQSAYINITGFQNPDWPLNIKIYVNDTLVDSITGYLGQGNQTLNELSNGNTAENLSFSGEGTKKRYLRLPKSSNVTSAYLDLKSYGYSTITNFSVGEYTDNDASGLEFDGNYFWVLSFPTGNKKVVKFSSLGSYIEEHDLHWYSEVDVTKLGSYFYTVYDGGTGDNFVTKYDSNWNEITSFNTGNYSRYITNDGTNLFVKELGGVVEYTTSGTQVNSYSISGGTGLDYNGSYFYTRDHDSDCNILYKYNSSFNLVDTIVFDMLECNDHEYYDVEIHENNMFVIQDKQYILNISFPSYSNSPYIQSANSGGIAEWNWSGEFTPDNGTQTVNLNATLINDYLSTCTADSEGYCNVPILFYSGSAGILEVSNIEVNYTFTIEPTRNINATAIQNYLDAQTSSGYYDIPIKISSETNSTIQVDNINITYYGSDNITVTAHFDGNADYNASNDTQIVKVVYSRFNYSIPVNYGYIEFTPNSPTDKNVSAVGMLENKPIINISWLNYDQPADLYIKINETHPCINITFSTNYSTLYELAYEWSNVWVENSNLTNGLSGFSYTVYPEVYYKGDGWNMIVGYENGNIYGYSWNGTHWVSNSSVVSGISAVDSYAAPCVFYKDNIWYLLEGTGNSDWQGYKWNGTQWVSYANLTCGLEQTDYEMAPSVFKSDNTWKLIVGSLHGFNGSYQWNGTCWVINNSIGAGLDIFTGLTHMKPEIFNVYGDWYLLYGSSSDIHIFKWNGTQWNRNTSLELSTGVSANNGPTAFKKQGTWRIIVGDSTGDFSGYDWFLSYPYILNTTYKVVDTNKTLSQNTYIYLKADYNCNYTDPYWRWWIPEFLLKACTINAVKCD